MSHKFYRDKFPDEFNIFVGSNILYFDVPSGNIRCMERCFVGIISNIDYPNKILHFVTLENNPNSNQKFYCKKSLQFKDLSEHRPLYPFDEKVANKYAIKYSSNNEDNEDNDEKEENSEDYYTKREEEFSKLFKVHSWKATKLDATNLGSSWKWSFNTFLKLSHETIVEYYSQNDQFPDTPISIYTIASTRNISYGDGGNDELRYPIFINDHLNVDKSSYKYLKTELKRIGNENGDYRENEPIQNVIDPDLYSLRLDRNVFVENYNKKFTESYNYYRYSNLHENFKENAEKTKWFIRGNYQMLPTVFNEKNRNNPDKASKIQIISAIHNIGSDKKYKKLYSCIAHVFECMLPMFNKFKKFRDRKNDTFQVIVKSQRYAIQPRKGYSGCWHTEGLTENISFVGLYYFEWNKGLSGGAMKFRPHHFPAKFYENNGWSTFEIECGENAKHKAMVWDNQYFVHRVRMLKNLNNDGKIRKKGYLAFFVIDPENELKKTTQNVISLKKEDYIDTLYKRVMIKHYAMPAMNIDICTLIVEYANAGITLKEAKKRRKEVIQVKKETKNKFGSISFGNCGEIFYFPMYDAIKCKIEYDEHRKKYRIFNPDAWDGMNTVTETQSNPCTV